MKTRLMLLCLACALLLAGCARKGDAPQAQEKIRFPGSAAWEMKSGI